MTSTQQKIERLAGMTSRELREAYAELFGETTRSGNWRWLFRRCAWRVQALTVRELKGRYIEAFGEPTRSGHKDYLVKRIAWRLQVLAEGDITERALRRAQELANDANLRIRAPTGRRGCRPAGVGHLDEPPLAPISSTIARPMASLVSM